MKIDNSPEGHLARTIGSILLPKKMRNENETMVCDVLDAKIIKRIARELLKDDA